MTPIQKAAALTKSSGGEALNADVSRIAAAVVDYRIDLLRRLADEQP